MKKFVMKCSLTEKDVKEMAQAMYRLFFNPKYIFRKFMSIRKIEDIHFIGKGLMKVVGHIKDFST